MKSSGHHSVLVHFEVQYRALFWEKVVLLGNLDELGNWKESKAGSMTWGEDDIWSVDLPLVPQNGSFEYKYAILKGENISVHEGGTNRTIFIGSTNFKKLKISDVWKAQVTPVTSYLSSSFFEDIIFRRTVEKPQKVALAPSGKINVRLNLYGLARSKQHVFVVGSSAELGSWDTNKAVPCFYGGSSFEANFVAEIGKRIDYKVILKDEPSEGDSAPNIHWENGHNRRLEISSTEEAGTLLCLSCYFQASTNQEWRGFGVAIPIFSLRTQSGMGIGEFHDLKEFVDFNSQVGSSVIQILPINDTRCTNSWKDTYPYSAISVFALHPIYLHIPLMTDDDEVLKIHSIARAEFNQLDQIDYERVLETKEKLIRTIFESDGEKTLKEQEYVDFYESNKEWLLPYASFLFLRKHCGTNEWQKWPKQFTNPTVEMMENLAKEQTKDFKYTFFVQFHLHKQLSSVIEYAKSNGIGLKGDLPIGVNPASADCWLNPHLFNLDMSTGSPPDMFCNDGQNWGFPTYNWEEMAKDGYAWWGQRLQQMAKYFQAIRIDHILGFFRIWEIPTNYISGLMGHFSPAIPVDKEELLWKGIWDINRLTEPYVTEDCIKTSFGNFYSPTVIQTYFVQIGYGRYKLQPAFDTEKKINEYISQLPSSSDVFLENTKMTLKNTLISAIKNVVLLNDPHNPNHVHPRINLTQTSSFQALDYYHQECLKKLHTDYFYHRQDSLWEEIGLRRLPVLQSSSRMLVCGEDLGMVPVCVPRTLKQLGIIGLCIQRMPLDSTKLHQHPNDYAYMTVSTPSSHDCSTIREWWEENRTNTQIYWNTIMGMQGEAPIYAEDWICRKIFEQHMHAKSILAIFPIQELFSMFSDLRVENPHSERINDPSIPFHYWRYRMHLNIEDLNRHEALKVTLNAVARESGRI